MMGIRPTERSAEDPELPPTRPNTGSYMAMRTSLD